MLDGTQGSIQMFPPYEMLAFLAGRMELRAMSLVLRSLCASSKDDTVRFVEAGCITSDDVDIVTNEGRLTVVLRYEASRNQEPA